jgi:predicted small secreted protein
MIRKFLAVCSLFGLVALAGCGNTVAGAGEDISKMGSAITKAAEGK